MIPPCYPLSLLLNPYRHPQKMAVFLRYIIIREMDSNRRFPIKKKPLVETKRGDDGSETSAW